MTIYNWAAYATSTDLGATTGFTRQSGNAGSIAVNASKNLDFVTATPNSLYTCTESVADSSFEVTLIGGAGTGGNFFPCCVRITDINNLIGARITSANNLELFKYVAGTATQLGSSIAITGRATGDRIRVTAVGNTITAYYNDVQKIQVTETFNNSATLMGFFARSSTINNFISAAKSLNLGVAISSINSGAGVKVGSTGNTIVFTGSTTLTALTIGSVSATNIAGSGTTFTFDLPSQTDNTTSQSYGTVTATATTGSGSLTLSTSYLPPLNYSYVTLADPINQTINGVVYNFSPAAAAGDQLAYDSTITTIGTDATGTTSFTGTQTLYHWSISTGKIYSFTLTTGANGSVSVIKQLLGSITSPLITSICTLH